MIWYVLSWVGLCPFVLFTRTRFEAGRGAETPDPGACGYGDQEWDLPQMSPVLHVKRKIRELGLHSLFYLKMTTLTTMSCLSIP